MAVIHALGCVTAHGRGTAALLEALDARRACPDRQDGPAPVERPALADRAQRLRFARSSRSGRLCFAAVHEALGGLGPDPARGQRAGLCLGTAFGAHLANERYFAGLEGPRGFAQTLASTPAAELAIPLGLTGPTLTLAQGPGAGLAAVAQAAELIDSGRASWMLAGAVDTLGETLQASGSVSATPSEGAVVLVLSAGDSGSGALARVAGWACAAGADARARVTAECLGRAAVDKQVAARIDLGPRAGDSELVAVVGDCQAATPLLAIVASLSRDRARELPLLVTVETDDGTVDGLCLT